jgi:3-hydroxyisobutyrate dehydrogenase-like beta-hydroxyacid dehydrogenase
MTTVVVIAQGDMGSLVARCLTEQGARVLTSLRGRSAASVARAKAAGMLAVEDDDALVAHADFILSIVPPDEAVGLAERLRPALARCGDRPVYVDCNTISPRTAQQVGAVIAASSCHFVDGSIFGPEGKTRFYLSGPEAKRCERLQSVGVTLRIIDGPIGAASAVKISYSGITKGLGAIGIAMVLGAIREGGGNVLYEVLAESRPALLDHIAHFSRRLPSTSYRWMPEMEEIATFLKDDAIAHDLCRTIGRFYGGIAHTIADDPAAAKQQADELAGFFDQISQAS